MAIERQKLQASLPRIGVVNVNTGVEQTYKTIARTSERIANDFAPFAQKRAEDAGINTAKAIAKQNFIDFDNTGSPNVGDENYNPNFGKPKAFAVPKDFGLVARSAYERVIERRFEESMQEELELKAIELSGDAKNSAEYNQRFTNYLAAMDKAASGRFGEYIQNTGTAILRDSLLKLQIKEQDAAVKYAKKQSKENVFFALRKLSNSVAMADDPESVNEIMTLSRNVTVAIEEDFALNQDKIEYVKNLDQIAFAKAGALTNLLSTSTANLPESERLRIAGALTNPALIKTIDSKITRQRIRSIIKTSNGMNLDKLSDSFTKQVDAVDQIQKAEDTEYFSNNENLFNQIITRASFDELVSSMTIQLDKAPEESEPEIEQLFANAIGNEFISQLTSLESVQNLDPVQLEILLGQIKSITNMQGKSTEPNVALELDKIKQVGVKKLVSQLINAEEKAQSDALDKLGTVINPKAKTDKLILEEDQRKTDEENAIHETASTKLYDTFIALYKDAEDQEDYKAMESLYLDMASAKNRDGVSYISFLGNEDLSEWTKITATNKSTQEKIKNNIFSEKAIAIEKEDVRTLLEKLRNADNLVEANNIAGLTKKLLKQLDIKTYSSDYIDSKLKEVDSTLSKFFKEDEAAKDLNFKNQATVITEDIRKLQELGEVISEDQVNKALEEVTNFLSQDSKGLDKSSELEFHNKIKNDYALSVIQPLMNTLREKTGGNGVSPALIKQAADIANTKNTDKFNEFVKELDKDSALYLMAKGLFDASKITTARSEIRTQLGKLLEYNTTQFDQYTKEIQITNDLDAVERLGSFSSDAQLRTYEDITYTKLAGLPEDTVIDYNNGKLFRTPSGQLTALGQRIFDDMQRGVRVPNLVASLELAASAGVQDGSFLFSIFAQGMNQQPNGTNNNLWVQGGQNQLSPDAVARFASSLILYKVGGTSTPSEALREIIGADQQAGPEGVKGYLKLKLGEDLEEWIADTYPEADFQSSQILKNAAIALGRNINDGGELKKILKGFINATYGYDDKVLGTVVDPMSGFLDSGYIFGSTGKPLVVGARSKYAGTKAMKKMDNAASQLIFENISDIERQRRFEIDSISATQTTGVSLTGVYFPPMPEFANKFFFGETEGGGAVVDEVGQMFTHDINFKYRESTQQSGVYYVMMPTVGGGGYQKLTTKDGIPVLIDIFEYQDKPKFHPNLLFYNRDFSRALSLDPNGGKFLQYKGLQPVGDEGRILNEEIVNVAPKSSTPLLRAEQALMLMRFPEMLANPTNRNIFKILVEEKVIRKEDVDFFIPFLEQYN